MTSQIDHVRQAREHYVIAASRSIMQEIRNLDDEYEQEKLLARKLNNAFAEYHGYLERMCNYYEKMAADALNMNPSIPFTIPNPTEEVK